MEKRTNRRIRAAIAALGFPQYEVARLLGYNPEAFNRRLRYELPDDVQEELVAKINKLEAVN